MLTSSSHTRDSGERSVIRSAASGVLLEGRPRNQEPVSVPRAAPAEGRQRAGHPGQTLRRPLDRIPEGQEGNGISHLDPPFIWSSRRPKEKRCSLICKRRKHPEQGPRLKAADPGGEIQTRNPRRFLSTHVMNVHRAPALCRAPGRRGRQARPHPVTRGGDANESRRRLRVRPVLESRRVNSSVKDKGESDR